MKHWGKGNFRNRNKHAGPQSPAAACVRLYRYAGTGLPYLIVHKAASIGSQS